MTVPHDAEPSIFDHNSRTLLASLLYYAATILLGHCLRSLVFSAARVNPARVADRPLWLVFLLDLITAFQVCACSLENGTLRNQYGMAAYLAVLFSLGYWHSVSLPPACFGNPCRVWRLYCVAESGAGSAGSQSATRRQWRSLGITLCRLLCQLIGGQLSFRYIRVAWSLGLCRVHLLRLAASTDCVTDLTVSLSAGFGIEFFGVFVDSLLMLALAAVFSAQPPPAELTRLLLQLQGTLATYYGLYLTGMYSNPANASAQTLGCRGTSLWQHALVYWLSPLLAVSLGLRLETMSHFRFGSDSPKDEKEKSGALEEEKKSK